MTLAEKMDSMMNEIRAIKSLNNSIKIDMENEISLKGIQKITTMLVMIENLHIPDVVCSFEEVGTKSLLDTIEGGVA